ncbi:hypothetical protein GCM10007140_32050 [Priestia taiwanensis]|uniref:Uncharacterized protein n=1 Tax=Priestia taiwanensis TaxID=1347902 RepID=A0A917AVY9_9BACI|nr:hypothetical protein GCM10007140_32050 [Priestia taiwanensis]
MNYIVSIFLEKHRKRKKYKKGIVKVNGTWYIYIRRFGTNEFDQQKRLKKGC